MSIKIKSLGVVIGFAFIALLAHISVEAAPNTKNSTAACVTSNSTLKDINNSPLPGSPLLNCADGHVPSDITVQGKAFHLYPFGSGPFPIANFGGIKRECDKLVSSNQTGCYTTNPFETPQLQNDICGYPSTIAYELACDASHCVAEIYAQACGSSAPVFPGNHAYTAPVTSLNIAGHITNFSDFASQTFASKYDFTENLNIAAEIVRQGRTPILGVGSLLLGLDGALRASATQDLKAAIAKYPTVFNIPGLAIEVTDEPFLRVDPATLPARIAGLNKAIKLLHLLVPSASLGVTVAPVWNIDPRMVGSIEAVLPGLQWLATDTYAQSLDAGALQNTLDLARQFSGYMKTNHPHIARWLIIQGFAPVSSATPTEWSAAQVATFEQFLLSMVEIIGTQYDGVVIWGWSNVYELPDAYAGKHFPPALKNFYLNKSIGD